MLNLNGFRNAVKDIHIKAIKIIQKNAVIGMQRWEEPQAYNVFSIAKSHLVTAIGMAIEEGKISLDAKPVDLFTDLLPEDSDPRWQEVTLYHLLTMTSGHGRPYMMVSDRKKLRGESEKRVPQDMMEEWLRFAFTRPMQYQPGEKFCYGNLAPYVAGRMLEKVVGMSVCDYLYEKFWKHTGMEKPRWDADTNGHTFAASDLYLDIDDLAKLGQLYVNGGVYEGVRYLSEEWVKKVGTKQVDSSFINPIGSAIDEEVGYGLYFWCNSEKAGGYRCYGKKGQFVIILPDRQAVIAVQAQHDDVQELLDIIWKEILPQL